MSTDLELLTNSRLKTNRACQRLHHLEFDLGYRPVSDNETLAFGTLGHAGLEAWWKAPQAERLQRALAAVQVEQDPYVRAKIEVLLVGYDARWGAEQLEALAVESEFRAPLVNPATGASSRTWTLAGKFDVIVRDSQGRVMLLDHKFTSEDVGPGSNYLARLRLDGQISVYYAGAKALGYDVQGFIYDVICKPGQRPLKATPVESRKYKKGTNELYANQRDQDETPEEYRVRLVEAVSADPAGYFQRAEVVRLESELEEAAFDVWQLGQQIRESANVGRYPRNPDACVRYGRVCGFFDLCSGAASLDDASRFHKLANVHPELSAVQQPAA
jgi:PD-(D/E)XK nuclease superfamily